MNLSVIWKLQDLMTPVMSKVSKTAVDAQKVIERVNTRTTAAFKKTRDSADSLNDKISFLEKYRNKLIIGVDDRDIRRANEGIARLQNQLDKVDQKNKRQQGLLGGFGGMKGMAMGYGIYEAGSAAINAIGKGMDLEVNEKLFQHQAGGQATEIMDKLNQWQQKYAVYSKSMLTESAARISGAFGGQNVMAMTDMIGKLAKGEDSKFQSILIRLEQIKGTGYLQGDELNELMNAGVIDVAEQLAKFRGISIEKFNQLKSKGLISANEVIDGLMKMTQAGGKHEKNLDIIMAATKGKWAIIKNTVNNAVTEMGKNTAMGLGKAMDWVIRFMNQSAPIIEAFTRIKVAFNPLINGLVRIAESFGLVSKNGDSVTKVISLIANVMNATAWFVGKVSGAVEWMANLFEKYPWTKYAAGFLAISYGVGAVNAKIEGLGGKSALIEKILTRLPFGHIASGFSLIATAMQALWANPIGAIILGIIALGTAVYIAWQKSESFRSVVIQTWEAMKILWSDSVNMVHGWWIKFQGVIQKLSNLWQVVWIILKNTAFSTITKVIVWFGEFRDGLIKHFNEAKGFVSKFWDDFVQIALKAIRATVAVATLGMSEIGIMGFNKFKTGYDRGAAVADKYEAARKAQEKAAPKKEGLFSKLSTPDFNMPAFSGGNAAGLGAGIGKATGITDAVNGSASKNVTINLNSKIADIYNTFSGSESQEDQAKKITDGVLMELNRILMTGNRLALE